VTKTDNVHPPLMGVHAWDGGRTRFRDRVQKGGGEWMGVQECTTVAGRRARPTVCSGRRGKRERKKK